MSRVVRWMLASAAVAACACGGGPAQQVAAPVGAPIGDPFPPVDVSCRSASDCAIKDVGNCCGYYPLCVNTAYPADPQRIRQICAERGLASPCGFPAIAGCDCQQGACVGK